MFTSSAFAIIRTKYFYLENILSDICNISKIFLSNRFNVQFKNKYTLLTNYILWKTIIH